MTVTVCAICLEPLTTGGALTPVHAACMGVDADLLAALKMARAVIRDWHDRDLPDAMLFPSWHAYTQSREMRIIDAAIAKAERTITDEPTGTDAPNQQGDDHAE
jgi:hypothetical protein